MKKGKSKYYGMFHKNQKFGKRTILDSKIYLNGKTSGVQCECECGSINIVPCAKLLKGLNFGCRKCSLTGSNNYAWTGFGEIPGSFLDKIILEAKMRNIKYDVSKEFLWKLFLKQNRNCALSNLPLTFGYKPKNKIGTVTRTASLDRINSNEGYTSKNVQWVHTHVNIMKNHYDNDYFIDICKRIAKNAKI